MIHSVGEILGLPPGKPSVFLDMAAFRYALACAALLWAAAVARARPVAGLLAGVLYVELALGFWVLALGRPYGLLEDPAATRWAATISVTALAGSGEGFVSGVPVSETGWTLLARAGLPQEALLLLPTLLPLLVLPAIALVIRALGRPRDRAELAALLWLGFSTGDLEALRGTGVIPGIWAHPGTALALIVAVAAVLLAGRVWRSRFAWVVSAVLLCLAWSRMPGPHEGLDLPGTVLLLTLDQGLWLPLACVGFARGADGSARSFALAGSVLLLAKAVLPLSHDDWGAHALYRLGLILAAAGPVGEACHGLGALLARIPRIGAETSPRLGVAALLLLAVPGSFLAWWDPIRLDPVADASLDPLPKAVREAMAWIRRETPKGAVFVASPDYAPAVAALAGRRVLRAPTLAVPEDDAERWSLEGRILSGRRAERGLARYGVSHVFITPGDFAERGITAPEDLEAYGHFRLRYRDDEGFRVYEIVP